MREWIENIKKEADRQIIRDLATATPMPTKALKPSDIMFALRSAMKPDATTLVFHPRHRRNIEAWHATYEHRNQITLVQSNACPVDKLYTFPTPPEPGPLVL